MKTKKSRLESDLSDLSGSSKSSFLDLFSADELAVVVWFITALGIGFMLPLATGVSDENLTSLPNIIFAAYSLVLSAFMFLGFRVVFIKAKKEKKEGKAKEDKRKEEERKREEYKKEEQRRIDEYYQRKRGVS